MGRILRAHLPGVVFHITARTQGKADYFTGIERLIVARIQSAPKRTDARIVAFAVMPNHLHIVALQGTQPLAALMQPLLSRIAVLIRSRLGVEGHVFERRFRARPCLDPDYFRNAIAYVHLNGYRAGRCVSFDDYAWCSHSDYLAAASPARPTPADPVIESALRVFATSVGRSIAECTQDYLAFLRWRVERDARQTSCNGRVDGMSVESPVTAGGDHFWHRQFAASAAIESARRPRRKQDLTEIAIGTILDTAPDMDLELLRQGSRAKLVVRVRRRFIVRAHEEGYHGVRIARFLGVSPAAVSIALTKSRMGEGRC